jgi:hypothetical protein
LRSFFLDQSSIGMCLALLIHSGRGTQNLEKFQFLINIEFSTRCGPSSVSVLLFKRRSRLP